MFVVYDAVAQRLHGDVVIVDLSISKSVGYYGNRTWTAHFLISRDVRHQAIGDSAQG